MANVSREQEVYNELRRAAGIEVPFKSQASQILKRVFESYEHPQDWPSDVSPKQFGQAMGWLFLRLSSTDHDPMVLFQQVMEGAKALLDWQHEGSDKAWQQVAAKLKTEEKCEL